MNIKKFRKSRNDRRVAGVIGGLGAYFGVDPTMLRVLWVLLVVLTGFFPGVVAYLIAIVVMPGTKKVS